MANQLLQKHFSKLKLENSLKLAISELVSKVSLKVLQKFRGRPSNQVKSLKTRDMNELILKNLAKLDPADVELNLRRAKLREAKRAKKELEAKLVHIKESIENFSAVDELAKAKPTLQDSQTRHEYFEEQRLKAKEVQRKAQEYRQQQKKRQAKIENYIKSLDQRIERDKAKKQQQLAEQADEKKKSYENYLQKIRQKAQARKKHLQEAKVHSQSLQKHEKPLYVKVSEKFWKDIEMPELEKRKADLQRKRMLNSYSSQQILDHAKWYQTVRQEHQKKYAKELQSASIDRKVKSTESTFSIWQQKIKNEEKTLKDEKNKEFDEILKKIDKRSQYSSLVRQMYPPSVDSAKSKEVEMRKLKFAASVNLIKKDLPESIPEKTEWKPHKFKPNKMITEKKEPRKSPEYVDYLKKMREEKQKDGEDKNLMPQDEGKDLKIDFQELEKLSEQQKMKVLKKKAKMIESELRKREIKYSKTPINLAETDDINDMLISSIKAKLAIIEKSKE